MTKLEQTAAVVGIAAGIVTVTLGTISLFEKMENKQQAGLETRSEKEAIQKEELPPASPPHDAHPRVDGLYKAQVGSGSNIRFLRFDQTGAVRLENFNRSKLPSLAGIVQELTVSPQYEGTYWMEGATLKVKVTGWAGDTFSMEGLVRDDAIDFTQDRAVLTYEFVKYP